jgi:[amino group carrier protein]-lysine/ornithine hydrolase
VVLGYKGSRRFTVSITRPAAHSAGPGPTAPECAVAFWQTLIAWCAAHSDAPGRTPSAHGFHELTATLLGMSSSNDGLRDSTSLRIGLRLPPGVTPEEAQAGVRALLPEGSFAFEPGEAAVRGGKRNPLVAAFLRSIRAIGEEPRFKVKTGTSDMNIVGPVWGCPMVAYGPGNSSLDHTPEEHLSLEEYVRAIDVLTGVLEGIAGDYVE